MSFKVEQNVPVPKGERRGSARVFPFDTLEIGESFTVPLEQERSVRSAASVGNRKKDAKSFTCQKQLEGTIRCWRVT